MSATESDEELFIQQLGGELFQLARLALEGDRRDVEMYVHRLAFRHRHYPFGQALTSIDRVPPVSLRAGAVAVHAQRAELIAQPPAGRTPEPPK